MQTVYLSALPSSADELKSNLELVQIFKGIYSVFERKKEVTGRHWKITKKTKKFAQKFVDTFLSVLLLYPFSELCPLS